MLIETCTGDPQWRYNRHRVHSVSQHTLDTWEKKGHELEGCVAAGAQRGRESQRPDTQENRPNWEEALYSRRRRLQRETRSRRRTIIGQRPP